MKYLALSNRGPALWLIWTLCLLATLLWDASPFDRWVMQALAGPTGFEWMHHRLLEVWLHTRFRQVALCLWAVLWCLALWPKGPWRRPQAERLLLVGLITLNVITINLLKQWSATSCPWDVGLWGGYANYVSHWNWDHGDGGPGRCFPGGHVVSALGFAPLVVARWWPVNAFETNDRRAVIYTVAIIAGTLIAGGTQTLRGAHYPSHTAWSAVICFGLALASWSAWHHHVRQRATSLGQASPTQAHVQG